MDERASQPSLGEEIRQLRAFVAELAARQDRQARIGEIMASAAEPEPPPARRGRPRRTPREQRWLHVVRGAAPLGAAGAFMRGHVRHAVAATAGALVLAGGTLSPDLMQPAPAAQAPAVVHPHQVARHRHAGGPVALAPVIPARRKRRRLDRDETATPRPRVTPSPPVTPGPDPSVTPGPDPSPSVTVPPSPVPSCTRLTGNHCHGGDGVVVARRALGGLTGSP